MRALPPITIGERRFAVFAEHVGGSALKITVVSGEDRLARVLNHQGSHKDLDYYFERGVNDFAQRLAEELAGRLRSEELARKFAAG